MATFSSTGPGAFQLSFAGISFLEDSPRVVRMKGPTEGAVVTDPDTGHPDRKQQPLADLIDEINRIIPMRYLDDCPQGSDSLGRNLDALAKPSPHANWPNPSVPIGTWYYPYGASRWSVFRGLATRSQVQAMLNATQSLQVTVPSEQPNQPSVRMMSADNLMPDGANATLQTSNNVSTFSLSTSESSILGYVPNFNNLGIFNPVRAGTMNSTAGNNLQAADLLAFMTDDVFAQPASSFSSFEQQYGQLTGPGFFVMKCFPGPFDSSLSSTPYTLSSWMYMLPPRPLAEHGGQFDGLYLVTLVDERYFWQYQSTDFSNDLNSETTWDRLIQLVGNALGVFINYKQIPSQYLQPNADSQLWCNAESCAALLDAIAGNIGCVVVRSLNGTYSLQSPFDSSLIVNFNRNPVVATVQDAFGNVEPVFDPNAVYRIAGGNIFQPVGVSGSLLKVNLPPDSPSSMQTTSTLDLTSSANLIMPAQVQVDFPIHVIDDDPFPHLINTRSLADRPTAWFEESYGTTYSVFITPAQLGSQLQGVAGISHSIHTTCKALVDQENFQTVRNQSDLQALAQQIATDYYNWQIGPALDEVYPGTYAWTPEGYHDIVWTYSPKERAATTRVLRTQWNKMVEEMQHSTSLVWFDRYGTPRNNEVAGIGGPSVAQAVRDNDRNFAVSSGDLPAILSTTTKQDIGPEDHIVWINDISYLPTQNRWKARVNSGERMLLEGTKTLVQSYSPNNANPATSGTFTDVGSLPSGSLYQPTSGDVLVFDGTLYPRGSSPKTSLYLTVDSWNSGIVLANGAIPNLNSGYASGCQFIHAGFFGNDTTIPAGQVALPAGAPTGDPTNGQPVGIVKRGIDGSIIQSGTISAGATISKAPNNFSYYVNAWNFEKGHFAYPSYWTSGGIQGASLPPPVQTVIVYNISGSLFHSVRQYSGAVVTYDTADALNPVPQPSGVLPIYPQEYIWIVERNNAAPTQSGVYEGQLVGYSPMLDDSNNAAGPAPVYLINAAATGGNEFWARLTDKAYANGQFTKYAWQEVIPTITPNPLGYTDGPRMGTTSNNPAYHVLSYSPAGAPGGLYVQLDDLPAHPTKGGIIVRINQSNGLYLIDSTMSFQIVQKTAIQDASGDFPGQHMRWRMDMSPEGLEAFPDKDGNPLLVYLTDLNLP